MKPTTVWYNANLRSTWKVLHVLRTTRAPHEWRVLASDAQPRSLVRRVCDRFFVEPAGLSQRDYVAWCLDTVQKHEVRVFVPGKHIIPLVQARRRFAELGVTLVAAASAPMLRTLASKTRQYAALANGPARLPEYRVVNDRAGFEAAYEQLHPHHLAVCYKPAVDVYGRGFRIIAERGAFLRRWRGGDPLMVRLAEARAHFKEQRRRDWLVMQYLPGPERSVDCLARRGELLRCVVRRKSLTRQGPQVFERNDALVETVRELTALCKLDAIYNVQFRDDGGKPYLLEINPRMSGGLAHACRCGVVFPLWALRLAAGTAAPADIPAVRTGMRINTKGRLPRDLQALAVGGTPEELRTTSL